MHPVSLVPSDMVCTVKLCVIQDTYTRVREICGTKLPLGGRGRRACKKTNDYMNFVTYDRKTPMVSRAAELSIAVSGECMRGDASTRTPCTHASAETFCLHLQ
jgi:hypothetical protein